MDGEQTNTPETAGGEEQVFLVHTWESVEGTYRVRAASQEEALAKFSSVRSLGDALDDETVEQIDYMSFDVSVRDITALNTAPAPPTT